ncbi:DUF3151 family protein [Agromyces aurantiacus]|uniref:DUF3151 family protein n=1 Tax=Agromyces aurantiacus TaxID=165814 RepID=A0ABV9R169_9MICO|nr:DUF3151 family protein [Agromyces aurantiacus]MBM7506179.1 hypothetical protein [Agromyces aurantiacus]
MTQEQTPVEGEAVLADEPEVRQALTDADRGRVAGVVAEHPSSPLAWAELADLADSEGRALDAFAYAVVAVDLAREQLAASGWSPGTPVPWSEEPNRAYLRALDAERRAAERLGLDARAERAADDLAAADPEAPARIASEFTPTQLITVVGAGAGAFAPAVGAEAHTGDPVAEPIAADAAGED